MRKLSFIFLFFLGSFSASFALQSFEATKVIINLNRSLQSDSIGYNLPLELPRLVYNKILNGQVTLWDSPNKEIKISADALVSLEKSSGTSFSMLENLFVHEIWELSKRYLDTRTIGFTFLSKNEKGAVSFGFIDYKDLLTILEKNNIPCNANGFINTTYKEAVQKKEFKFSIVQFGDDNFSTNPNVAFDIQKQLFNNSKIKLNNSPKQIERYKSVTFEIANNDEQSNKDIYLAISNYFQNNLEQFFNLGGDQAIPFFKKDPLINLTKIKVTELYKYEKGKISSELSSIQLYIHGKYLPSSDLESLRQMPITVIFKPLLAVIAEKNYSLTITSINSEEIKNEDSLLLLKKLKEGKRNILVKY